jgi:hypothetical protein
MTNDQQRPPPMTNIAEVLTRLEQIIVWAEAHDSPLGYFAALYHRMTAAVQADIAQGVFENGSRMERLDVLFAQRYFNAFDAWQAGQPTTKSWQIAFQSAENQDITVMQHLLLGINAHINLDLGIAAANTRPGDSIYGLRVDFNRVNDTIAALTDRTQARLADIWLPFGWLDHLLQTDDEGWVNFSIATARGAAWKSAVALAFAQGAEAEKAYIQNLDAAVALLATSIAAPPTWLLRSGLWLMRRWERGSVREKIALLRQV